MRDKQNMDYEQLIKENEWIILSLIKKYSTYSKEDLYQAGVIGIIKASNNYNPNAGIKFSTYAYKYVLGEIIKCISEDRSIKVSDEYVSLSKKYLSIKKLLTNKYSREVSFKEVCEYMQIDEMTLLNILEMASFAKSIDDDMFNYGEDTRNMIDDKILISNEIDNLNDFDKSIIHFRYFEGRTQSETAEVMGISQVKVSREEKLILTKMKNNLCI